MTDDDINRLREQNKILRDGLNSVIAASHSWVIIEETARIENPIHEKYRLIAKKTINDSKDD